MAIDATTGTIPSKMNAGRKHAASGAMARAPADRAATSTADFLLRRSSRESALSTSATGAPETADLSNAARTRWNSGATTASFHALAGDAPRLSAATTRSSSSDAGAAVALATAVSALGTDAPDARVAASRSQTSQSCRSSCRRLSREARDSRRPVSRRVRTTAAIAITTPHHEASTTAMPSPRHTAARSGIGMARVRTGAGESVIERKRRCAGGGNASQAASAITIAAMTVTAVARPCARAGATTARRALSAADRRQRTAARMDCPTTIPAGQRPGLCPAARQRPEAA